MDVISFEYALSLWRSLALVLGLTPDALALILGLLGYPTVLVLLMRTANRSRGRLPPTRQLAPPPAEVRDLVAGGWGVSALVPDDAGEVDGHRYTVRGGHGGQARVSITLQVPLPAGLVISRETALTEVARYQGIQDLQIGDPLLDDYLHVRGTTPDRVQAFTGAPATRKALQRLARMEGVALEDTSLAVDLEVRDPADLGRRIAELTRLAVLLEEGAAARAQAAARALGLKPGPGPGTARGRLDGQPTTLQVEGGCVRVSVALPAGPLAGLRLARTEDEVRGGVPVRLANPILGRLVQVRADAPEAVAPAFDEAATEAVLAVIQGHPGARVHQGVVTVPVPRHGRAEAVESAAREAAALVTALAAALAARPPG